MTRTLIRNGRVIDPARGLDRVMDVAIDGGVIVEHLEAPERIIDADGLWVVPGLIDVHVHLRDPGDTHKEDLTSGLGAAVAGGFTRVLCMPNTRPAIDTPELVQDLIARAGGLGLAHLHPVAAITRGRQGRELAPLEELRAAGAAGFSDDGAGVADDAVMEAALIASARGGFVLGQHAEDPGLCRGGVVHEGEVSRRLGVKGWPAAAEEAMVRRDIELLSRHGGRLHVTHVSTAGTVALVREAKARGLAVTAEVTPHHLWLTDEAVLTQGTQAKVNPPLRAAADVAACRAGLGDGTLDVVATDHAPHAPADKAKPLDVAAFGLVGLETAVPLLLRLVAEGVIAPARLVDALTRAPSHLFGLPGGHLTPGAIADVTLLDPATPVTIDPATFRSKSRNTPFSGFVGQGRVVATIVCGEMRHFAE